MEPGLRLAQSGVGVSAAASFPDFEPLDPAYALRFST